MGMSIAPSSEIQSVPGSNVSILFGAGTLSGLPSLARKLNASRLLLVTDAGIRDAGHVERAVRSLYAHDLTVRVFDQTDENPTTLTVARALKVARDAAPGLIVGLGGGSSMDTAKGVNFLLTNGGRMQDYWGTNKASKPMLPLIAIPTTSGTGSEAQSYALITDPDTHQKMACGDEKALPRFAILDPELTVTQPSKVAAATGIDAITHAVETAACTKRTETSRRLSREAWDLLHSSFESALSFNGQRSSDADHCRGNMLMGAHLAGCAIQNSMLGAAHSAANPLTAHFKIAHGLAVGIMLPHVIRFNCQDGANPYADLNLAPNELIERLNGLLAAAGIPRRLRDFQVTESKMPEMSKMAAAQWTASFNPRPVAADDFEMMYRAAL
jgi:alcohol dehydrogenase